MKKILGWMLLTAVLVPAKAQQVLSLDSCRALALRNNKQLAVSRVKQDVATNLRRSARTKYLPHVSAVGGYVYTSREVSLLSDDQKSKLNNLGTTVAGGLGNGLNSLLSQASPETLAGLGQLGITPTSIAQTLQPIAGQLGAGLNGIGQGIVDAFHTDTRNMWVGSVAVTQPVFMGGSITALNRMADISEDMARNSADAQLQATIYDIDQAYWTVVSLKHKQRLAEAYRDLVTKLDGDVQKMIQEGVATRSEGLSVSVKVNEAEMSLTKVNDGLALAKMYLCQLCGLPCEQPITLADEDREDLGTVAADPVVNTDEAVSNRPELRMLQNTVDLSTQATKLLKAGNLPQVLVVGGYTVTNPNVLNGFERKFGGLWSVGVLVRVPIWNWGGVAYKVRASKGATTIARLELDEAREKIGLQVSQSRFRVNEANKKLAMTQANIERAEENLRTATLGFHEGVISSTTVMEAQTAWLQAQSQKIDAEIDLRLSQVNLRKSLGRLGL